MAYERQWPSVRRDRTTPARSIDPDSAISVHRKRYSGQAAWSRYAYTGHGGAATASPCDQCGRLQLQEFG